MDALLLFPTKYVSAGDLQGCEVVVTIRQVAREKVENKDGTDLKGVMYFHEFEKGMILNKTNGERIMALYGRETDHWIGSRVTLYPSETDMQGKVVPCVRVREQAPRNDAPAGLAGARPTLNAVHAQQPVVAQPQAAGFNPNATVAPAGTGTGAPPPQHGPQHAQAQPHPAPGGGGVPPSEAGGGVPPTQ